MGEKPVPTVCFIQNTPGSIGSCPLVWILESSSFRLAAMTPAQGKSSATAFTPLGTMARSCGNRCVCVRNCAIGDGRPGGAPRRPVRRHLGSEPDALVDRPHTPTARGVTRQSATLNRLDRHGWRTELNT